MNRYSYAYRFLSDRIKIARYAVKDLLGVAIEETELSPEESDAAWALELEIFREIDRLAKGSGARTLILVIPDQVQVQPEWQVIGLDAADYEIQERMRRFGEESGIPVLDVLPVLRARFESDAVPLYYRRDRHLNALGQSIVSQAIYDEMRRLGLLDG